MGHIRQKTNYAVLAVSFGTTDPDSLKYDIGAAEQAVAGALPEFEFRRAFASQFIIDRLRHRDGIQIDNISQALKRAADDGIEVLAVQPTYFTYGCEYAALEDALRDSKDKFGRIYLGQPLLHSSTDLDAVVMAAVQKTAAYDDGKTAVCLMGHGTKKETDSGQTADYDVYIKLQEKFLRAGYKNYYAATMQPAASFDGLITKLQKNSAYERAVLMPLMLSAGRHAEREMAGSGEDSWKNRLVRLGFEVVCIMEGFGQIRSVQELYAAHVQAAVRLQNCI